MKRKTRSRGFVSIHVRQITGLDSYNGSTVYIDWYRGSRSKHSGHTKFSLVREGTAVFDERIEFSTTFFQNIAGEYDEKLLSLALVEASSSRKTAVLLKTKVNLMAYLPEDLCGTLHTSIPLGSGGAVMDVVVDSRLFEGTGDDESDYSMTVDSVSTAMGPGSADGGVDPNVPYVSVTESQALIDSLKKEIHLLKGDNQAQKQAIAELEITYEKLKEDTAAAANSTASVVSSPNRLTSSRGSNDEAHVLKAQKKTTTIKKRMTVAPGSLALQTGGGSGTRKAKHASGGKRIPRLSVDVSSISSSSNSGGGEHGRGVSLAALLATTEEKGRGGAADDIEKEFWFISGEIYGTSMKVVNCIPTAAQAILDKLQETNAFSGSAEARGRLGRMQEALEGALGACKGNLRRMAYWLAVHSHAILLAQGILTDDKILKDERAKQHEAATALFSPLAAAAYAAVAGHLIAKLRPHFLPTIFDIQFNDEMQQSFPGVCIGTPAANSKAPTVIMKKQQQQQQQQKKKGPAINLMDELFVIPFSGMVSAMTESGMPPKVLVQVVDHLCKTLCAAAFNHIIDGGKTLCSVQMGFRIKLQLSKIRDVMFGLNVRDAYNAFSPLEEAAILMITDPGMFVDVAILKDVCPSLTLAQARAVLSILPKAPQTFLFRTRSMVSRDDSGKMADPPLATSVDVE